jgi:hypothetical protein
MISRARKIISYTLLFLLLGTFIDAHAMGQMLGLVIKDFSVMFAQTHISIPKPGISVHK